MHSFSRLCFFPVSFYFSRIVNINLCSLNSLLTGNLKRCANAQFIRYANKVKGYITKSTQFSFINSFSVIVRNSTEFKHLEVISFLNVSNCLSFDFDFLFISSTQKSEKVRKFRFTCSMQMKQSLNKCFKMLQMKMFHTESTTWIAFVNE